MKVILIIFLSSLLFACDSENSDKDEPINQENKEDFQTTISDFKINDEVELEENNEEFIEAENKVFIAPAKLFDFYPNEYKGIKIQKNSSGNTSSELGKYTTSTAVIEEDDKIIRIRFSDYYGNKYFPEYKYYKNLPEDNSTYTFERIKKSNGIEGIVQWHRTNNEGKINVLIYNRFNLILDVNGYSEMKTDYDKLINKFELEKLKEISNDKQN